MIDLLPTSLEVAGKLYRINADFRNILLYIYPAFNDDELSDIEKAYVCVKCLFVDDIPMKYFEEAVKKAYWFCDGGDMPKSEPTKIKTLDWEHDAGILFPAVNKVLGFEIRSVEFLHWWTVLGTFGEIDSSGLFASVMSIRYKKAHNKPLDKSEREYVHRNKEMFNLMSKEDREAVAETEEFLKELI